MVTTFDAPGGRLVIDDLEFSPLPPCPNAGAIPRALTVTRTALEVKLAAGADSFSFTGTFSSRTAFDPASTQTTYLTLSDSAGGVIWASEAIAPGGAGWRSSKPTRGKFVYQNRSATPGL